MCMCVHQKLRIKKSNETKCNHETKMIKDDGPYPRDSNATGMDGF